MLRRASAAVADWFGPQPAGHLWPRWLFLRALGLIFFSAFYSFLFQADGLIGPHGILPAQKFLEYVGTHLGVNRYLLVPSLFWLSSGTVALKAACWAGLAASALMTLNLWPRGMALLCTILYLSFISTLQVFSSYQSDGMLLEAGLLSVFFAPSGLRPGLGAQDPPSRACRLLLLFLVFRIYFESGLAKMLGGDPHWRHFTAMDDYYQNGPLPTWIGWYAQQLPHGWHAFCSAWTLGAELILSWLFFVPVRRVRIVTFWVLLPFQTAIILTANYAFINHITIALAILLLDDRHAVWWGRWLNIQHPVIPPMEPNRKLGVRVWGSALILSWVFYGNAAVLLGMIGVPLPMAPVQILEPFRFVNRFGLFAVMTPARYEIEFQGTSDGIHWIPYPFRYKPQDIHEAPRIFAPYQPRFDWNLWFASLGPWRQNPWVVQTQDLLLRNEPSVLSLFRSNPFPDQPPKAVRTVFWQYWFTDLAAKRRDDVWWRRRDLGLFGPTLDVGPDGRARVTAMPSS